MAEIQWLVGEELGRVKPLFVATPDTGLVAIIAAAHLIQALNAKLMGYVDAEWIPPVSVVSNGDLLPPIRLYTTENLNILLSEAPISPLHWRNFAYITRDIALKLSSQIVIATIGIPNIKRMEIMDISNLRVLYAGKYLEAETINEEIKNMFKQRNKFTGTLAGPYSAIANSLIKSNIPFLYIFIDSYPDYPDPEAAARVIQELNHIIKLGVDIEPLIRKGSEIRLMARQLALQTKKHHLMSGQKTGNPPIGMYV